VTRVGERVYLGRCDAGFAAPCLRVPVTGRHGRTGPAGLGLVGARIRHVIEKSSETPGNCSKAFRFSWDQPVRSLLKNPRFPKAIRVLRWCKIVLRSCPEALGSNPAPLRVPSLPNSRLGPLGSEPQTLGKEADLACRSGVPDEDLLGPLKRPRRSGCGSAASRSRSGCTG
jgi:hypothetical protein